MYCLLFGICLSSCLQSSIKCVLRHCSYGTQPFHRNFVLLQGRDGSKLLIELSQTQSRIRFHGLWLLSHKISTPDPKLFKHSNRILTQAPNDSKNLRPHRRRPLRPPLNLRRSIYPLSAAATHRLNLSTAFADFQSPPNSPLRNPRLHTSPVPSIDLPGQ